MSSLLNAVPQRRLRWQEVTRAADSLELARLLFFFDSAFAHAVGSSR